MKITIKNYELLNIYTSLNTLITQKLPVSVGWNLTKNRTIIKGVIDDFFKAEQSLVSEYAIKRDGQVLYKEDGQPEIQPKYKEVFLKEHNELLNCENQVDLIPINLSDILYTHINNKQVEREIEPTLLIALSSIIIDSLTEEENKNNKEI